MLLKIVIIFDNGGFYRQRRKVVTWFGVPLLYSIATLLTYRLLRGYTEPRLKRDSEQTASRLNQKENRMDIPEYTKQAVLEVCSSLHCAIYDRTLPDHTDIQITDILMQGAVVVRANVLPFTFYIDTVPLLSKPFPDLTKVSVYDNGSYITLTTAMIDDYRKGKQSPDATDTTVACHCSGCNTTIDCAKIASESRTYADYIENMNLIKAKAARCSLAIGAA